MIDLFFLIVLLLAIVRGWRKGFVLALFSVLCCVLGLAAAVKLSAVVAGWLGPGLSISSRWLPAIAFILVFVAAAILVRWIARLIEAGLNMLLLGWLNRLAGILLFILLYMAVYSVILFYGTHMQIISSEAIKASNSYPWIAPWGPGVVRFVEKLIPLGRDMFAELEIFFDKVAHHIRTP
jgi:membrane protein required for colicin V production